MPRRSNDEIMKDIVKTMDETVKIMESHRERERELEELLMKEEPKPEPAIPDEVQKAFIALQTEALEINEEFAKLRDEILYEKGIHSPVDGKRVAQLIDRYFRCLEASQTLTIQVSPLLYK